jgi:hypothetical protein
MVTIMFVCFTTPLRFAAEGTAAAEMHHGILPVLERIINLLAEAAALLLRYKLAMLILMPDY